jgi:hypothetical protein
MARTAAAYAPRLSARSISTYVGVVLRQSTIRSLSFAQERILFHETRRRASPLLAVEIARKNKTSCLYVAQAA